MGGLGDVREARRWIFRRDVLAGQAVHENQREAVGDTFRVCLGTRTPSRARTAGMRSRPRRSPPPPGRYHSTQPAHRGERHDRSMAAHSRGEPPPRVRGGNRRGVSAPHVRRGWRLRCGGAVRLSNVRVSRARPLHPGRRHGRVHRGPAAAYRTRSAAARRRASLSAAARGSAGGDSVAAARAAQHPGNGLAAEHGLRRASGRGGDLPARQPGAAHRRRPVAFTRDLLPRGLLDVLERGAPGGGVGLRRRSSGIPTAPTGGERRVFRWRSRLPWRGVRGSRRPKPYRRRASRSTRMLSSM